MRILIAEDTDLLQTLHQSLMARWGYEYDLAADGAEAVRRARSRKGQYDLCIMDVSMPKVDGFEATRTIRRELPYFPILGYSSDERMREPCLRAGMDDFLPKHSESARLREAIDDLTVKRLLLAVEDERISLRKAKQ